MTPSLPLLLDVAGVILACDAPADWQPALAARYAPFVCAQRPPDAPESAVWRIVLRADPTLAPPEAWRHSDDWIAHDGALTRFAVAGLAGTIDLETRTAAIAAPNQARAYSALERTAVYIAMQALPRSYDGLLLHGCGVVRHGQGLAFIGHSGAGKTTTARLAQGYGEVLGDENVVLRPDGADGATLWSTPFWGGSTPPELIARVRRQVPLQAIYMLEHAPAFELTRLAPAAAVLALLTSEKIPVERPESAAAWLRAAERLLARVPCYRLGFRPTAELWPFLDKLTVDN